MLKLHVILLALVCCTPGCFFARSTTNEPLRQAQLARLVPGTSTARDVVEALGAPTEVVQLGLRTAYRYDFTTLKREGLWLVVLGLFNEDTRSDRAWFFFDAHDLLTHAGVTLEGNSAQYTLPWKKLHEQ